MFPIKYIQRARISDKQPAHPDRDNLFKILDFEYMGAAEYELGDVPRSHERIKKVAMLQRLIALNGQPFILRAEDPSL